jgi:hypothetical protein
MSAPATKTLERIRGEAVQALSECLIFLGTKLPALEGYNHLWILRDGDDTIPERSAEFMPVTTSVSRLGEIPSTARWVDYEVLNPADVSNDLDVPIYVFWRSSEEPGADYGYGAHDRRERTCKVHGIEQLVDLILPADVSSEMQAESVTRLHAVVASAYRLLHC